MARPLDESLLLSVAHVYEHGLLAPRKRPRVEPTSPPPVPIPMGVGPTQVRTPHHA
jgi:hypothetical protein